MNHLIVFAAVLHSVVGLIGYDCGSKILNITTLSLLDIGPCDIPQAAAACKQKPNKRTGYSPFNFNLNQYYCLDSFLISVPLAINDEDRACGAYGHAAQRKTPQKGSRLSGWDDRRPVNGVHK